MPREVWGAVSQVRYDEPVSAGSTATSSSKACNACGGRFPGDALFCPNDGSPLTSSTADRDADPYLGQEISGHIEIRQLVGIGAMGRVYRAFQRGIDRDVAVKILHRELSANAQLVSRFTREAKVASRLQHPNVVQVLLAGQLPDRALYMVMEYLDGLSLQSALAAVGGALPLPRALHISLQLCEATGEAHAQGIVHRDLKPENVMLVRRGADNDFVKVLDFGIARINWGEQSVATAAGLIFGTARYISPEGAQGHAVGPASDVYSIATLLYQMLSGRTPFEGDQAVGLLVQQIHDEPPHLRDIPRARYVPDAIADVVMANLAKDPKQRDVDARALGHALFDAAKTAGLSPDEFSRPLLRRGTKNAMQLPPMERTKQFDLTPDIEARMTPQPNGESGPRSPMGATTKWEPPPEFQARLAGATPDRPSRPSGIVDAGSNKRLSAPPAPISRPKSVDETLDDGDVSAPAFPSSDPRVPRTVPGDAENVPRTQYAAPSGLSAPSTPPPLPATAPSARVIAARSEKKSPAVLLVLLCFVLGALIAAGWAWRMGKIGGDSEQERFVARAQDAMFKNRFGSPPGENVKDITDEGLRRFPNERRLVDIRIRTANELSSQAQAQRAAGDVAEALRLAKLAHELDPNDASAKRLVDQYEAEIANVGTQAAAPPLAKPTAKLPPVAPVAPPPRDPPKDPPNAAPVAYAVVLDVSAPKPKLGQTVEIIARIAPTKGSFDAPAFTIAGPGAPSGIRMPAQSPSPGVFRAGYAFLEAGKYEISFSVQADGKPLGAKRVVSAGEGPAPSPPPTKEPVTPPPATTPTTAPSVKWM